MKSLIAILMVLLLAACQTTPSHPEPQVRVIDTACTWVKELSFSKEDTKETKRQIIEHDMAYRKNCPKKQ